MTRKEKRRKDKQSKGASRVVGQTQKRQNQLWKLIICRTWPTVKHTSIGHLIQLFRINRRINISDATKSIEMHRRSKSEGTENKNKVQMSVKEREREREREKQNVLLFQLASFIGLLPMNKSDKEWKRRGRNRAERLYLK
jgi:hypothetical protein